MHFGQKAITRVGKMLLSLKNFLRPSFKIYILNKGLFTEKMFTLGLQSLAASFTIFLAVLAALVFLPTYCQHALSKYLTFQLSF